MEQSAAIYTCIFLLLAVLYDQTTKRIPSRLHADQAPKSGYGLVPAGEHGFPPRAFGIE
jgi:hypothetical protein